MAKMERCGRPCRKRLSFRDGTFFEKSNFTLKKIIRFIYLWAHELLSVKTAKREFKMSNSTIVDWKQFLRDICAEHFMKNPVQLGGPGITVEIDESVFTRRKYNRGRMVREQWVFGGIDVTAKKGFLIPVGRRDAATLLPIVEQFILPGSTIVSDCWRAYNALPTLGYNHLTVNHTYHFVDPDTYAHTNNVENMWMRAKMRSKREMGTKPELLESYLIEFMWRTSVAGDPFDNIIDGICLQYRQ